MTEKTKIEELLFKVLDENGASYHFVPRPFSKERERKRKWFLPEGNQPGQWMPTVEALKVHQLGYYLRRGQNLLDWLGPTIYLAEARGEKLEGKNEICVQQARLIKKCESWNKNTAILFACDCAERILPIFEKTRPEDHRPRKAIETTRKYLAGKATKEEMVAANTAAKEAAADALSDDVGNQGYFPFLPMPIPFSKRIFSATLEAAKAVTSITSGVIFEITCASLGSAAVIRAGDIRAGVIKIVKGAAPIAAMAVFRNTRSSSSAKNYLLDTDKNIARAAEREWQNERLMKILGVKNGAV